MMSIKRIFQTFVVEAILCSLAAPGAWCQQGMYQVDGRPASEQEWRASQLIVQGLALLRQNQNGEAADVFAQACSLGPNLASAHVDYAIALSKLNKNDAAIVELKQAVQLDPSQPSAWLNLGGLYQTQGQIGQAIGALTEFTQRFPTHPDAPKVRSLIQGLIKLNASLPPETQGSSAAQAAGGDGASGNANQANRPDDYFSEATLTGVHRWPASLMPLKIYLKSGDGVPFYKEQYNDILKRAFTDWANVSSGKMRVSFVDSPDPANIVCSWTSDPAQLANAAEAGETQLSLNSKGILRATIVFLTVPLVQALPITDNRLRVTCLHEVGHALGLTGHTRNPADIMFFSSRISDDPRDLTQRDKNTLVRLYSDNR
jgi:predicted Zn-dependent protease